MVSFVCDVCGDTIKKPKIKAHMQFCSQAYSCVDCSKTFYGEEVRLKFLSQEPVRARTAPLITLILRLRRSMLIRLAFPKRRRIKANCFEEKR